MKRLLPLLILALVITVLPAPRGHCADSVLTVVSPWPAKGLDPIVTTAFTRMGCLETLTKSDGKGGVEPCLAESWSLSDNGLVWTFHLRPGVIFHDGSSLTARAVVVSLTRPDAKKSVLAKTPVTNIRAQDDDTVTIETSTPFAALPAYLAHQTTAVISPASMDEHGTVTAVVGTGYYRLDDFGGGTAMKFSAFDGYWGEKPAITRAAYLAVPDPEARALMAESGEADIVLTLSPAAAERLSNHPNLTVRTSAIPRVRLIKLNCALPMFDTPQERLALSLAIDRQGIARAIARNPESAATQFLPPVSEEWHIQDLKPLTFDPDRAQTLLGEQGWTPGPDGVLVNNGQRFEFDLLTYSSRPLLPVISEAVQSQLMQIGVKVNIRIADWSVIPEGHDDGSLQAAILARNFGLVPDPVGNIAADFGPERSSWGAMAWSSPRMNDLLASYQACFDPQKRAQTAKDVIGIIQDELPLIPVSWYDHSVAVSNRVTGVFIDPYEQRPYPEGVRWAD